jgi:hypothetical protein
LGMILFTYECPVNLSVPGTHKNDCVWAKSRPKVEPIQKSKLSPKIMVWGAMTASGLSKLHVLPQNQTVRSKYNQESILSFILPGDMNKAGDPGIVTERRFYENMLDLTLLQDRGPAHRATETQNQL